MRHIVVFYLIFFCSISYAQEGTYDDFSYQFNGCSRLKTTMTCSFQVTNLIANRNLYISRAEIIDNLGKKLSSSRLFFPSNGSNQKFLITGVPTDLIFVFEGINPQASKIESLSFGYLEFVGLPFTEASPSTTYTTIYDDAEYKLSGCNKSNNQITCLITITNKTKMRRFSYSSMYLYDNLGTEFVSSNVKFLSNGNREKDLLIGVPEDLQVVFEGIFTESSEIALFSIEGRIKFYHVLFSNPQPLTAYDKGKQEGMNECLRNPTACKIALLTNISANSLVPVIGGFAISGTSSLQVILRGMGVESCVDPLMVLQKYPSGEEVARNNNWGEHSSASRIANLPSHLKLPKTYDAGMLLDLSPGYYTISVSSIGCTGNAVVGVDKVN